MSLQHADDRRLLLRLASRGAFWNAVLLPLIAVVNLLFAVLLRRGFGLFSGVYDVLLGVMTAVLQYSSVGIPTSLTKLVPEVGAVRGSKGLRRFLWRISGVRLAVLGLFLLGLNLVAESAVRSLGLGDDGVLYLRLLTVLACARAVIALGTTVLNALLAQRPSNTLALAHSVLDLGFVTVALAGGRGMIGVLWALVTSSTLVAIVGTTYVIRRLERLGPHELERPPGAHGAALEHSPSGFARFSLFTYSLELSTLFVGMGFAAPALAVVLAPEAVALFATAFKLSFMTVGLAVSGFRGLYRPLFARLRLRDDPSQLRRAYAVLSKAQLVVLWPAGVGLIVMSADYIPLLFGPEFRPAVPVAWVLIGFMYAETAFNLPLIILFVDEQYRAVFWAQAVTVLLAPVFLASASELGLIVAAGVFGVARAASALVAYGWCRRLYGLTFPWAFAGRVGAVSLVMGGVLVGLRSVWPTSPLEAVTLTVVGVLLFGVGVRLAAVLSREEADVIQRSGLPGRDWLIALLVSPSITRSTGWGEGAPAEAPERDEGPPR